MRPTTTVRRRRLGVALPLLVAASPLFADPVDVRGPYVGIGLGAAYRDDGQAASEQALDLRAMAGAPNNVAVRSENRDLALRLTLGWRLLPALALEAGYVKIGDFETTARVDDPAVVDATGAVTTPAKVGRQTQRVSAEGYFVQGLVSLPLFGRLSAHAKSGAVFARGRYDCEDRGFLAGTCANSTTQRQTRLCYGLGVAYETRHYVLRADADRVENLRLFAAGARNDVDLFTLGAAVRF